MQNHSEWRIDTKIVAGKEFYQVYRLLDISETDCSENREKRGGLYESIRDAKALARRLNTEEAIKC